MIKMKRAYEAPAPSDGRRYLVDRLWPRGKKKDELQLTAWMRDIAPSNELRKWFGHVPERYPEFQARYRKELEGSAEARAAFEELLAAARAGDITLIYSAQDEERNQAVLLKAWLEERLR